MITLEGDRLIFRFPEVHEDAACAVDLQRTLRIPDDDRDHALPPGLGRFPLRHLDDHADRVPEDWQRRGGVIAPMHQAEAMWLNFTAFGGRSGVDYPIALKIGTGKINAVSGEPWSDGLNRDPQDYVVLPEQPWVDGYCIEEGVIRQFVSMPLGMGYSVEEQLTGAAEHGGLQIMAFPMKTERYRELVEREPLPSMAEAPRACMDATVSSMGLAPGGRMRQQIYDDPYGLDAWDQRNATRCFVTLLNSMQWMAVTGERPPSEPPTAADYTKRGLPWFDYYDADAQAIAGAERLGQVKSAKQMSGDRRGDGWPETGLEHDPTVRRLGPRKPRRVRETRF